MKIAPRGIQYKSKLARCAGNIYTDVVRAVVITLSNFCSIKVKSDVRIGVRPMNRDFDPLLRNHEGEVSEIPEYFCEYRDMTND